MRCCASRLWSNQDVEGAGCSGNSVDRKCVGADDEKSNLGLLQSEKEIAEILVENWLAQSEALDLTIEPGMLHRS